MNTKYVGAIGYILILAGMFGSKWLWPAGIIGWIVAGIAWIMLGKELDEKVLKINGISMIVLPVIGLIIVFLGMYSLLKGVYFPSSHMSSDFNEIWRMMSGMTIAMIALVILGTAGFILHVIAHLRTGNRLNIGSFRYSAYCQILSFILAIVSVGWFFGNFTRISQLVATMEGSSEAMLSLFGMLGLMVGLLLIAGLVMLIGYIFTIMGFFSIGEKQPF